MNTRINAMILRLATLALVGIASLAHGQQPNFLVTTGTTTTHNLDHLAYIVWEPTSEIATSGRSYAVYAKVGQPGDVGSYVKQAVISPIVSAEVFAPLLELGKLLGDDLSVLSMVIDGMVDHLDALVEHTPEAQRPSIARSLPLPEKMRQILIKCSQHPAMLQGLASLRARHPSMALCLAEGWTGVMPAQVTTYEIREFDIAANKDIAVVGRITLDWTVPPALVAAGKPIWVPNDNAEGDLNIRLRWAVPEALRRLGPQVQGYNLYRTTWQHAREEMGWHVTAPTLSQLHGDSQTILVTKELFPLGNVAPQTKIVPGLSPVSQPSIVVTRPVPVFPSKFFSDADVESIYDSTFFFADDNRRYDMVQPGAPFVDQAEYGYIVVPRDMLGREGPPSLAGLGVACRTLPPDVPGFVKAKTEFVFQGGNGGQKIVISWKANKNAGSTSVTTGYEVLRSRNIADFTANNGKPLPNLVISTQPINHTGDEAEMTFSDVTAQLEGNAGNTFAYAVRALRDPPGPCGPFYSAPSPPVFGILRSYQGPQPPTGGAMAHCTAPFVGEFDDEAVGPAPADGKHHFQISCRRKDQQISAVSFFVINNATGAVITEACLLNHLFESNKDTVSYDFAWANNNISVIAYVFGSDSSISFPYLYNLAGINAGYETLIFHGEFRAATIDPCSKRRGEPVAALSYGRSITPSNAVAQFYNNTSYVTLAPNPGYEFSSGALVNVAVVAGGFPFYLTTVTASSPTGIIFVDPAAAGMTPEQLKARYRLYTDDKSNGISVNLVGPPMAGHAKRLAFNPGSAVPDGTQVCITRRGQLGLDIVGPAMVKNGQVIITDNSPEAEYEADVFLGALVPGSCKHAPVATGPNGELTTIPVKLELQPMPGSVEYRIYRRVDEGSLSLLAQGDCEFSGDTIKDIIRSDDSMPAVNCVLRYYGQTLDKNGNPSALVLLDTIKLGVSKSTPLPTPMMLPPKLTVDANNVATLHLSWFCSSAGVDRFQIDVKTTKSPPPSNGGLSLDIGYDITDPVTGAKVSLFNVSAYVSKHVGESYAGPTFTYDLVGVDPGQTYYACAMALAPEKFTSEGFDVTPHGEPSLFVGLAVPPKPVTLPDNVVPWPARGLPPVISSVDVGAVILRNLSGADFIRPPGGTPSSPASVGVKINQGNLGRAGTVSISGTSTTVFDFDPNVTLKTFPATTDGVKPMKVLPAVLYRQQVRLIPGTNTPRPDSEQGALVQCSPLISEVAYSVIPPGQPAEGKCYLNDPAVWGVRFNELERTDLYLMDKLPVIKGATYRYWLVHFSNKNEPDRTINAGTVTIPSP